MSVIIDDSLDMVDVFDAEDDEITWHAENSEHVAVEIDDENIVTLSYIEDEDGNGWQGQEVVRFFANDGELDSEPAELTVTVIPVLDLIDFSVSVVGDEELQDVEVEDEGTFESVRPGQTVIVEMTAVNKFEMSEDPDERYLSRIVNINLAAEIGAFGIEDTAELDYLDGGESQTGVYEFTIPADTNANQFLLSLEISGNDVDHIARSAEKSITFNVDRFRRSVSIEAMEFSQNNLTCDKTTTLYIDVVNSGDANHDNPETVTVSVYNEQTETELEQTLNVNQFDTVTFEFDIDAENARAVETFDIRVSYFGGSISFTDSIDLTVHEYCMYDFTAEKGFSDLYEDMPEQELPEPVDLREYTAGEDREAINDYVYMLIPEVPVDGETIMECSINDAMFSCDAPLPNMYGTSNWEIEIDVDGDREADATQEITLTVEPVPDAPVLAQIQEVFNTNEGELLTFDISATDADNDLNLVFSISNLPGAQLINNEDNTATFSWTPHAYQTGEHIVEFKVRDSAGLEDSQDVTINVIDINHAPEIIKTPDYDPIIPEDGSQVFNIRASDHDNDFLAIQWYLDGNAVEDATGPSYTFNADNEVGQHRVSVEVVETGTQDRLSASAEWLLRTSNVPVKERYDGTLFDLTPEQLEQATDVTIELANIGRIDFGDNVFDLRDVVDIDRNVLIGNGVAGINSDELPQLDAPATITFFRVVNYNPDTSRIFYNDGFVQENSLVCEAPRCTNINYDSNTGMLTFDVSGFSLYWYGSLEEEQNSPVITSEPVTEAYLNQDYTYDVDATDEDGNEITFSLTTAPEGMTIDADTGLISWTPLSTGTYPVTVDANDGTDRHDTQSFDIIAREESKLVIDDLDVKVNTESDKDLKDGDRISKDAEPGDTVDFKFKIENRFTDDEDIEISDIELIVTILDIDDGDDLEEEADEFDLDADDKESMTLSFDIPLKVDSGTYDVKIELEGEDDNGLIHRVVWYLELDVDKQNHDVRITDARLGMSQLSCTRTTTLAVDVLNVGEKDEDDARLTITSNELGINVDKSFELEEGNDDDAEYSYSTMISLDSEFEAGTYPITIKTYYDGNRESDSQTLQLTVEDCGAMEQEEDGEELIVFEPTEPTITPSVTEPSEGVSEIGFRESPEYLALLVVLNVIVLGLVIFGIGAMIIRFRR